MLPAKGTIAAICTALGLSRASLHRSRKRQSLPPAPVPRPRPSPPRALPARLREAVLDLLRSPRFADLASAEIYATLLDEGAYHCSNRTMYRVLGTNSEVRARRQQLRHPAYQKPKLLAEELNQVRHHASLGLMTPDQVHYGQADAIRAARQQTLDRAFVKHPERFVKQPPRPPQKPVATWINPPQHQAIPASLN